VAIVGGGLSGVYMAYQLQKHNNNLRVAIFEASGHLGGRLFSVDNDEDNDDNQDELGAMRIFKSQHKPMVDLIEEVGCSLVPFSLEDGENIFYYKGERMVKNNAVISKKNNKHPLEIKREVMKKFFEANGGEENVDAWNNKELRNLSLRDLFKKYGATDEEFKSYISYSGYDLLDDDVTASLQVAEGVLYGSSLSDDQCYIREGYQEVCKRLADKCKAKVLLNTTVKSVKYAPDGKTRMLKCEGLSGKRNVSAKVVVLSLPRNPAEKLLKSKGSKGISKDRVSVLDAVKVFPLFKCFVEWERVPGKKQWWKELGFLQGKSTTDLNIRQLHYYDNEDLLVYSSGEYAVKWDKEFQKSPLKAKMKVLKMIKTVHNVTDIPDPDFEQTIYKYWPNGSHKWRKGVDVEKSAKLYAVGKDNNTDDATLYLCGDAMSQHQGWTMGCIQTVDMCFEAMKKRNVI